MEEDLSNRTITILVVLTVTISVLGTLSVMNAVNEIRMQQPTAVQETPAQGKVGLTIVGGGDDVKEASATTGMVGLEIKPPKEEPKDKILLLPE